MRSLSLAWLLLYLLTACGEHSDQGPDGYNLVLISIDTLGADHLGLHGYDRETSPNLDRYAASSIVFERAYSTAPKTAESHMSMFTSLYPSVHRVFSTTNDHELRVLDDRVATLPEILKENGYATVGFHGGGFVDEQLGFARGFDNYQNARQHDAEEWLKTNGAHHKFFLFYHTYAVHDPYTPGRQYESLFDPSYEGPIVHDKARLKEIAKSKGWGGVSKTFWSRVDTSDPREVAHLLALYDASIVEMDQNLTRLLEAIDRDFPKTVVVIVSDHGEEFGQHGMPRHTQLYREVLHVPLIIRHPRFGGMRVPERVSLIDLAPTILDMLSISPSDQHQGRSLLSYIDGASVSRPVFSEYPLRAKRALLHGDLKLMTMGKREEYYDLQEDPREQHNLRPLGSEPTVELAELRKTMARIVRENRSLRRHLGIREASEVPADQVVRQLRALGYLDQSESPARE